MLIFLDLQTTGLQEEDKICSIGLIAVDDGEITVKYDLVNEGKKISPKASSIHHITNEMIKDKPNIKECEAYRYLQEFNNESTTIIAHNVQFDLQKLLACGFEFYGKSIDTLRVTKHLIPECEAFSLQFLRYELKLYADEKQEASACGITNDLLPGNALSNALFVKTLYSSLAQSATKEQMCSLSLKNVLMQKFEFGKYAGRYIEEICISERGYPEWMLSTVKDLDEDLRYTLAYYLYGEN
ncbi:3'-5' exonuclease [bacterium]|nr:3'-5' exonuclease [bacterium]MBU1990451.1 3'-5' exonuclease [bacterium]